MVTRFIAALLHQLREQRLIVQTDGDWTLSSSITAIDNMLPHSINSLLVRKVAKVTDTERKLLTAAALIGRSFDDVVLADALKMAIEDVEEHLETLDQVHAFINFERQRTLPNGTATATYQFIHGLYRDYLAGTLAPRRRARLSDSLAASLLTFNPEPGTALAIKVANLLEFAGIQFRRYTILCWQLKRRPGFLLIMKRMS